MTTHSTPENGAAQVEISGTTQVARGIPRWIALIVILGAVLTLTGAVIGKVAPTILTGGSTLNDAGRVYADYLFARNLAVGVMLLLSLSALARHMLAGFMVLSALIQVVDSIDDLTRGAWVLVPGLVLFAVAFLLGAWRLFGKALWSPDTWRAGERHG